MRKIFCLLLFLGAASFAYAEEKKVLPEVTGLEWLELSASNRMDQMAASMTILSQNGIKLSRSLNDYYNGVNELLRNHPELYEHSLTNILADYVRARESQLSLVHS